MGKGSFSVAFNGNRRFRGAPGPEVEILIFKDTASCQQHPVPGFQGQGIHRGQRFKGLFRGGARVAVAAGGAVYVVSHNFHPIVCIS